MNHLHLRRPSSSTRAAALFPLFILLAGCLGGAPPAAMSAAAPSVPQAPPGAAQEWRLDRALPDAVYGCLEATATMYPMRGYPEFWTDLSVHMPSDGQGHRFISAELSIANETGTIIAPSW